MAGVAESKAAQAYFSGLASQRFTDSTLTRTSYRSDISRSSLNVFVAVGGVNPVLYKAVMERLCKSSFQSTGYLYHVIPDGGHFLPEWAAHVPQLAEAAWWTVASTGKENGATWVEASLGQVTWTSAVRTAGASAEGKPTLTFATGNANKLRESREILAAAPDFPYTLVGRDLDLPEIQGTTQEVARAKCREAAEVLGGPCITDDTALAFHALGGLPGPYVKDFVKNIGLDGLNAMLDGFADRSATAIATFAYCAGPGQPVHLFEGKSLGRIVPPRGPTHFGWDPILEIPPTGLTYAEMEPAQKNSLSHRYKALCLLQYFLISQAASTPCNNPL
jgi:inosine triphosphate pyrophosphatase